MDEEMNREKENRKNKNIKGKECYGNGLENQIEEV